MLSSQLGIAMKGVLGMKMNGSHPQTKLTKATTDLSFYRTIIADIPNGIVFVVDSDLRYLLAEGQALKSAGLTSGDLEGKTIFEALDPELAISFEDYFRQALSGQSFQLEHSSHDRVYITHGTPLHDVTGEVFAALAVSYDITEHKISLERARTEAALRESEERYRLLVEGAKDYAMFMMDTGGCVIHWNVGAERIFGYSRDEVLGQRGDLIFTPDDRNAGIPNKEMETAIANGRALDKRWHIRRNGERVWMDGLLISLQDEANQFRGFVKIARDATKEREAEEALRRAYDELEVRVAERTASLSESREQLRLLSMHMEKMHEDERMRISREVHDELGGNLTALKFELGSLVWGHESDHALTDRISNLKAQIDNLIHLVRHIASDLRPPVLDHYGLIPALEWHVHEFERHTGIQCNLDLLREKPPLSRDKRTAVFRVFQEALTNVARHAQATQVNVAMSIDDGELFLILEDNGVGFDIKGLDFSRSLGLKGMQERMMQVRGTVEIDGEVGRGTVVIIRVPFIEE